LSPLGTANKIGGFLASLQSVGRAKVSTKVTGRHHCSPRDLKFFRGEVYTARKDKHTARLKAQARTVNFVWNHCNEAQRHAG
jgi:hypothetical protein